MKYIIEYRYRPDFGEYKFFASTEIKGEITTACGHSFTEARTNLIKNIKNIQVPPSEEIEI